MYSSPVRHSPPTPCGAALPFDLHVLGLPPAFTLSQDQTLHLNLHGPKAKIASVAESVQPTYSLYVVLAYEYFESCDLFERLLMVNCHHQTPAQVTCAHCQRSRTRPQRLGSTPAGITSARGSRTSYKVF